MCDDWQQGIVDWIQQLPQSNATHISKKRKRQVSQRQHYLPPSPIMSNKADAVPSLLPSASASSCSSRSSSPSKRPCPDPDATPRARPFPSTSLGKASSVGHDSFDDTSANSKRRADSSKRSGRWSPTKMMALLRREHVIDTRPFGGNSRPPAELYDLVRFIADNASGIRIMTLKDRADIIAFTDSQPNEYALFDSLLDSDYTIDEKGERETLGALPPIQDLVDIWKDASTCEQGGHSEAEWNCAVHRPLLHAALRWCSVNRSDQRDTPDHQGNIVLKVCNVTTAQIVPAHLPSLAHRTESKRVDFCLYLQAQNREDKDAIAGAAGLASHSGINHTDYTPLLDYPISVSVETKHTGEDWKEALHQMSIWLAAHWNRLDSLVPPLGETKDNGVTDGGDSVRPTISGDSRIFPAFLPGIIIQGHDWFFVAASRGPTRQNGDREIIVWSKMNIGTTDNLRGIVQIVAAIQRLAQWSALSYWPWFQKAVLAPTYVFSQGA